LTKTVQVRSCVLLSNAGKNLAINTHETEDNKGLILYLYDSLNTLYEKLSRLEYLLKRKQLEKILYKKEKEKKDED